MKDLHNPGQLTIGRLAESTGLSVSAIRYYEDIGLIPKAQRRPSGHRVYGPDAQGALALVRSFREFGFPIEQIRVLMTLSTDTQLPCDQTRAIAQEHLGTVRSKIAQLRQLEGNLMRFIRSCSESCIGGPAPKCSILKDVTMGLRQNGPAKACC